MLKKSRLYIIDFIKTDYENKIRDIFIKEYNKMEELKLIETPNNYIGKVEMVRQILEEVKKKKIIHYKKYVKYKKINTFSKTSINTLNTISVCSIVLTLSPTSPIFIIIGLSTTTLSSIFSAISSSIDIENKVHSHNTSYLQYSDLYRDVSARLLRNGMSSEDLDNLLNEINNRIGLIEDQAPSITIK